MAWIGAPKTPSNDTPKPCIFCDAWTTRDDRGQLVLTRSLHAYLILNAYPYAPGHLMVAFARHLGAIVDARPDELTDAMTLVQRGAAAIGAEYRPDGYNIGINQGAAAGAGIADHLHIHVVPRWSGDSNFIGVIGETRVLPETLDRTWERLRGRLGD
jgi:ATP adenylyltransferase